MKKALLIIISLALPLLLRVQDSVLHRIVYIVDAGELSTQQGGYLPMQ